MIALLMKNFVPYALLTLAFCASTATLLFDVGFDRVWVYPLSIYDDMFGVWLAGGFVVGVAVFLFERLTGTADYVIQRAWSRERLFLYRLLIALGIVVSSQVAAFAVEVLIEARFSSRLAIAEWGRAVEVERARGRRARSRRRLELHPRPRTRPRRPRRPACGELLRAR